MLVRLEIDNYRWICPECNCVNFTQDNENDVKCADCKNKFEIYDTYRHEI